MAGLGIALWLYLGPSNLVLTIHIHRGVQSAIHRIQRSWHTQFDASQDHRALLDTIQDQLHTLRIGTAQIITGIDRLERRKHWTLVERRRKLVQVLLEQRQYLAVVDNTDNTAGVPLRLQSVQRLCRENQQAFQSGMGGGAWARRTRRELESLHHLQHASPLEPLWDATVSLQAALLVLEEQMQHREGGEETGESWDRVRRLVGALQDDLDEIHNEGRSTSVSSSESGSPIRSITVLEDDTAPTTDSEEYLLVPREAEENPSAQNTADDAEPPHVRVYSGRGAVPRPVKRAREPPRATKPLPYRKPMPELDLVSELTNVLKDRPALEELETCDDDDDDSEDGHREERSQLLMPTQPSGGVTFLQDLETTMQAVLQQKGDEEESLVAGG